MSADAAYWTRVLARLWVHDQPVALTFVARDGSTKTWSGVLAGLSSRGPLIVWQGRKTELCPWSKLIAVEDAARRAAGA